MASHGRTAPPSTTATPPVARTWRRAPTRCRGSWRRWASGSAGRRVMRRLLDDLGGLEQHVVGEGEAKRLGGLEVDYEVEAHRLLDREVSRLGALEDAVDEVRGPTPLVGPVRSIAHQPAHGR